MTSSSDFVGISIKSNITLRNRIVIPPMDNSSRELFDVRLRDSLTKSQSLELEKEHFRASIVLDSELNEVEDNCYKGCIDCGDPANHCQRPQNIIKQKEITSYNNPPSV